MDFRKGISSQLAEDWQNKSFSSFIHAVRTRKAPLLKPFLMEPHSGFNRHQTNKEWGSHVRYYWLKNKTDLYTQTCMV